MSRMSDLQPGETAKIASVEGQDGISQRLLEMGLIPGTDVQMLGRAPLGDPLEFLVRGYRLSVRKSEAQRVTIGEVRTQ